MKRFGILARLVVVYVVAAMVVAEAAEQPVPTLSLQQAASRGDIEQLNLHIARGADLNKPDQYNMTALGRSIQSGHADAVKVLVDAGADVNVPTLFGPPIIIAATRREKEIVELLAAKGADVNAKGRGGQTVLIAAVGSGDLEVVQLLVEKGADVNVQDDQGQTALSAAQRWPEIADFLRSKGAQELRIDYGQGPYGERGIGAGGGQSYRSTQEETQVLADPNAVRAKIAAVPGLTEALAAVDANAATEERAWASRRGDNRTVLVRGAGKQFAEELAFLKGVAAGEKAEKTVAAIDELVKKRAERDGVVARELREARRLELEEARGVAGRTRGRTSARGARGRSIGDGYGEPGTTNTGGPYGGVRPGQLAGRPGGAEETAEPALDPDTEGQVAAWVGANPEDKRTLLASVRDLDLYELDGIRLVAVEEQAKKTTAAIEGIMLARQTRVERITARMAEEDARLERLAERTGAAPGVVRGRRVRGAAQPGQPQGETPTPVRRPRRGR